MKLLLFQIMTLSIQLSRQTCKSKQWKEAACYNNIFHSFGVSLSNCFATETRIGSNSFKEFMINVSII